MAKKQMSQTQKKTLLEFMEENPQLVTQKISNQYTSADMNQKWAEITDRLNSIPGCNKSWKEWRKVCIPTRFPFMHFNKTYAK